MAADAVLFDLDGTVWDSWPWFARCIGRDATDAVARAETALRSGRPVAAQLRIAVGPRRFADWCRDRSDELVVYPGAVDALRRLRRRRRPLGAVTNLPEWIAAPMLQEAGVGALFDTVVTYLRPPKPHPRSLLVACSDLDAAPSATVWYVGDTDRDRQAAQRAGLSFAWASWGYGAERPTGCDRELAEIDEVLDL